MNENKILRICKQDDLESFIEQSSELGFDPFTKFRFNSDAPIMFADRNSSFSYLQIMAFYGSVKCFKYACLQSEYDTRNIEPFAVAGGNLENVHILEQ